MGLQNWQEYIIKCAAELGIINYQIFRLSNIFGEGCRPGYNSVIATYINLVKKNQELELYSNGSASMDLVYVNDLVNFLAKFNFEKHE